MRQQQVSRLAGLAASRAAAVWQGRSAPLAAAAASAASAPPAAGAEPLLAASGSRVTFHSGSSPAQVPAATAQEAAADIPFPREGPGVSYALNWSLAAAGVTPSGDVSRNLKPEKLAALAKGAPVKSASGSKLLIQGSKGDTALAPAQFKKVLREVTAHLSSLPSLFVHDGAVGSSSSSDARTRVIASTPAAAAALKAILTPTPTRALAADSFPITVYAVPEYKSDGLGAGFIAADLSSSLIVAAGSAVGDAAALKAALAAAAVGPIAAKSALALPGRFITPKGGKPFLLLTPSAAGDSVLAKSSAFADVGVIWGAAGVARPFALSGAAASKAPNLYGTPSAVILVTSDSTGALPAALPLTPQQAAFHFVCGYDGSSFHPAFARSPISLGSASLVTLATTLASLLSKGNIPAYLVNANGQADLGQLVSSVASGSAPAGKIGSEDAWTALKTKLEEYAKATFPALPEDIVP